MTIFEHLMLEDDEVRFLDFRRIRNSHDHLGDQLTRKIYSRKIYSQADKGLPVLRVSFQMTGDVQRLISGKGEPIYELDIMALPESTNGALMDDPDSITEPSKPMMFMIARGEMHRGMGGRTAYSNAKQIPEEILSKYWHSDRYYSSEDVQFKIPKWMIDEAMEISQAPA